MHAKPAPHIDELKPYKPGLPIGELARIYNLRPSEIIKLASNENPFGPSPAALAVLKNTKSVHRYPDQFSLISALSDHYGLSVSNIIIGNGSNDILDLIARVFLNHRQESISSQYAFIVYRIVTQLVGATNVIVPAREYGHDLSAMYAAITKNTRVVWLANPNNPTGTFVHYNKIKSFLKNVPDHIIVVLDEAYFEYLDPSDQIDTTQWIEEFENLIIVRTFSKIYGLAGLRVGYGIGSANSIELLNRARQPFNVNALAMYAAIAALSDTSYVSYSRNQNKKGLALLRAGFQKMTVPFIESYGNFLTVFNEQSTEIYEQLLSKGIITRPITEYGLPNHLRISVGTDAENSHLLKQWDLLLSKTS